MHVILAWLLQINIWIISNFFGETVMKRAKVKKTKLPPKNILLETMFDKAQVAILITDADSIIEYVNPEFTIIFGYSEEEALGKSGIDLIMKDIFCLMKS